GGGNRDDHRVLQRFFGGDLLRSRSGCHRGGGRLDWFSGGWGGRFDRGCGRLRFRRRLFGRGGFLGSRGRLTGSGGDRLSARPGGEDVLVRLSRGLGPRSSRTFHDRLGDPHGRGSRRQLLAHDSSSKYFDSTRNAVRASTAAPDRGMAGWVPFVRTERISSADRRPPTFERSGPILR